MTKDVETFRNFPPSLPQAKNGDRTHSISKRNLENQCMLYLWVFNLSSSLLLLLFHQA